MPSSRRRPPPPRLNCPPFLFCLSPPPRVALHQISIGSKMVAPHLDFTTTTSFVNSTSKALAAGARSHSILRGTLGFRSGRVPAGWLEERADEGARRLFPCLSSLTCLQRLEHQSAALVVSLIWLLLACRPPSAASAGSCWRAGSSVVAAPARLVIPPPHTLRYAAVSSSQQQGARGVVIMPLTVMDNIV